jgi:excisionase family DNA binding protein
MNETVLISLSVKQLEILIIDCVNACLSANGQASKEALEADEILTIKEAAILLSLSVPTIYGLVSRSEIPVNKQGKRLYFSKHELIAWIKTGRKKTGAEIAAVATEYCNTFNKRK